MRAGPAGSPFRFRRHPEAAADARRASASPRGGPRGQGAGSPAPRVNGRPLSWPHAMASTPTAPGDDRLADLFDDVPSHDPVERTRLRAEVEAGLFGRAAQLPRIGRYQLLQRLGGGGQGIVYAAHDPELDRRVAVKVLRTDRPSDGATDRLLREAAALARLSHPNIVTINDVGTHDAGVYIVTQLVEGQTLTKWLGSSRSWREIVQAFLDAGAGLIAAHEQGIVHRDFKPDNVLVGNDGRIQLVDFGLATATSSSADDSVQTDEGQGSTRSGDSLTQTGVVMGTPAYMAPEQHLAQPTTPATDQYAFCVSLHQALYGQLPFVASSIEEVASAKQRGPTIPANAPVPASLGRMILRGLAPDPADRWPSMRALTTRLRRVLEPRRRGLVLGAGAAVLVGALAWLPRPSDPCEASASALAGTWDDEQRRALEAAMLGSGVSHAPQTWPRARARLDAYAQAWTTAHGEACQAARDGGDAETADAQMRCLDGRRRELRALVRTLADGGPSVVDRAVQAVVALPDVERCREPAYVLAQVPPPDDPAIAEKVEAVRAQVHEAFALRTAGRPEAAIEIADRAARAAAELGYPPLVVEAGFELGTAQDRAGEYEASSQTLRQAYFDASAQGMDELAAKSATALALVRGSRLQQFDEGLAWAEHAQAALDRAPDARTQATLLTDRARIVGLQGRYEQALAEGERALALQIEALGPEHPDLGRTLNELGLMNMMLGRHEQAQAQFERAIEIWHEALGPDHPNAAGAHHSLAGLHMYAGRYEDGEREVRRALTLFEAVHGPEHPDVAAAHSGQGVKLYGQGKHEEARREHLVALAILEPLLGPEHSAMASIHNNLGQVARAQQQYDEAIMRYRRAQAIWEQTLGADYPEMGSVDLNLGLVELARGRYDEAEQCFVRGLERLERTLGPTHREVANAVDLLAEHRVAIGDRPGVIAYRARALSIREQADEPEHKDVALSLDDLAEAYLLADDPAAALPHLERSVRMWPGTDAPPEHLARAHALLARAQAALAEGPGAKTKKD
jgi:tetratricopeptide (TPR) repeat protein